MIIFKILGGGWTKDTGLSCPDVKVNRPEPTDLSIFIAQKIELFKEKMNRPRPLLQRIRAVQRPARHLAISERVNTKIMTRIPNRLLKMEPTAAADLVSIVIFQP